MLELIILTAWTVAVGYAGYSIGYHSRNREISLIIKQRNRLYRENLQTKQRYDDIDRQFMRSTHAR